MEDFQRGAFGLNCGNDEKKINLSKYKNSIRRLMPQEPDNYWRQVYYIRHRNRLEEIDGAPPTVHEKEIPTTYAVNRENDTFDRVQRLQAKIDRDNALLVNDIYKIYTRNVGLEDEKHMETTNINWKKRMLCTLRIGLENCEIYNRLQEIKPVLPTREAYDRWHKEASKYRLLASRFPPYWDTRLCTPYEKIAWERSKSIPRPIVYLDFEVLGKEVGRVVFELRADLVPKTAENFRSLCTGDLGKSYKCSEVTRILDGIFWQGGAGITSIYGDGFSNENYKVKHDAEGIISMISHGEKTNNSEFRISAAPLGPMDKRQVAFGKVIMGMNFLKQLASIAGVTESGKPKTKVIVTGGGETTENELVNLEPPNTMQEQRKDQLEQQRSDRTDVGQQNMTQA